MAMHTSPTAKNSFLVLMYTFLVHSPTFIFPQIRFLPFTSVTANAVSRVGAANEMGHPVQ